jgi:hypothetical protein
MMWRGVRNWPLVPAEAQLREHVLIEVALGVAVLHGDCLDLLDHSGQQGRGGDQKHRIPHVFGIGAAFAKVAHVFDERECLIPHDPQHLF